MFVYTALGALLVTGHLPLAVAGTAVLAVQTGQGSLHNLPRRRLRPHPGGDAAGTRLLRPDHRGARVVPLPGERAALDDISLSIRAGQIIALVGENGSGKTTLAALLAGLYQPTAGRIRWDGTDLAELDPESLSTRVAVITQDYARFPFTAGQNITLGADTDPDRLTPPATPAPRRSSPGSRAATTPCSTGPSPPASTCPAGSGSGWPSPAGTTGTRRC